MSEWVKNLVSTASVLAEEAGVVVGEVEWEWEVEVAGEQGGCNCSVGLRLATEVDDVVNFVNILEYSHD